MSRLLVLALCFGLVAGSSKHIDEVSLMRSEARSSQDGVVRVAIDQHSRFLKDAPDEVALVEGGDSSDMTSDPCSYLGCNSHKCAWASGGAITRLTAKKSCSNALSIGSAATPAPTASGNAVPAIV